MSNINYSSMQQIPCGTKFLRVLIFAIFANFFAIHKNKFGPQNKITTIFCPQKFTPLYKIIIYKILV